MKFSKGATEVALAPWEVITGKAPRTLAEEILSMDDEQFSVAFKKSAIKRAKGVGWRGMRRWCSATPGTVGPVTLHCDQPGS